jgi:hypothetical protein
LRYEGALANKNATNTIDVTHSSILGSLKDMLLTGNFRSFVEVDVKGKNVKGDPDLKPIWDLWDLLDSDMVFILLDS